MSPLFKVGGLDKWGQKKWVASLVERKPGCLSDGFLPNKDFFGINFKMFDGLVGERL